MSEAAFIAVDWGTSRLRAFLLDASGAVLERYAADRGIQTVRHGEWADVLAGACGGWLAARPGLPVVMAGMVGSRNGWAEAPYAPCPADAADIAARMISVTRGGGGEAAIVPGLTCDWTGLDGAPVADVMRGEETLILGTGVQDGVVVLPGTHSKWARVETGRIMAFATAMTGELYAVLKAHSILGRLAEEPEDPRGFALGLVEARREGGLTHQLFSARAQVLAGRMNGACVAPYLSGLLIAQEIDNLSATAGGAQRVCLVAEGPVADLYRRALDSRGFDVTLVTPEAALLAGLRAIETARVKA